MSIETYNLLKYAIPYFITLLLIPTILLKSPFKLITKIITSIILIGISILLIIHTNGMTKATINYIVILIISILYIIYKVIYNNSKNHKKE